MTMTVQTPTEIRFADGSQVRYLGKIAASFGRPYYVVRANGRSLRSGVKTYGFPSLGAAVAALAALGEGPAGKMKIRE